MAGRPWRRDGNLHAQVEGILKVPNVAQEALQKTKGQACGTGK